MRPPCRVAVGDACEPRRIGPLTRTDLVRFAGAGGDFNPLHHDAEFAVRAGFPDVIAMGQLPAGMLAGLLSDWLGVEHLLDYEVRFVAPVHLGAVLELTGRIASVDADVATVDLLATVAGDPVVTGSAHARVAAETS